MTCPLLLVGSAYTILQTDRDGAQDVSRTRTTPHPLSRAVHARRREQEQRRHEWEAVAAEHEEGRDAERVQRDHQQQQRGAVAVLPCHEQTKDRQWREESEREHRCGQPERP